MYLLKVGGITRKRFVITEKTLIDVLKARLKGEKNVSIRKHIRQMIERVA